MKIQFKYAGVGSRRPSPGRPHGITPQGERYLTRISARLHELGGLLRTGDANGSDEAFRRGAPGNKQVFTPDMSTPEAMYLAAYFHPAWDRCSDFARKLHARNCFQVLGPDLDDPVDFLVCWRNPQARFSGTDQAIRLAQAHSITVFNLADPVQNTAFAEFIRSQPWYVARSS